MPRTLPAGLKELLARRDAQIETHSTLQLFINTASLNRAYYFATARLVADNITWLPELRRGVSIRQSITRSADQATLTLQNVDTNIGADFLDVRRALSGAKALGGRFWRDLDSGATYHKVLITGVVVGLQITENTAELSIVSDLYASISVGASQRIRKLCRWRFRDPRTCQYSGSLLECNLMLNHADGCQGRHGDPLKRAKFGGMVYMDSSTRITI